MNLIQQFIDPPREFSVVPFWFLNERLDKKRLQWQVEQMHRQHVYGAVMHARPGLVTPYLSEEWFQAIGHVLDKASDLGMFMWMYDEYPWMSGMAEWRVPKIDPDFRIRALDVVERFIDGPDTLDWAVCDDVRAVSGSGKLVALLLSPVDRDGSLGPASDVTDQLSDGHVELSIPPGRHHAAAYFERMSYNPYGDQFGTYAVTDLMNQDAIQAFIQLTHRQYADRFPRHMGSTITATFTDEPPADTPGWSVALQEEFRRRKGYDLVPHLGLIWHDGGPITGKVRYDYGDVVGQLYEEAFFGKLEDWADTAGIASSGHLLLEETLPFHARFMGDYFRSMRRLHYPGIDYIFPGVIPAVVPKMAASIAALHGRKRVMSECFALTGWDFTFEHMKWMADWQLVHGVNLFVPHAFFYAITETEPIPEVEDDLGFRWYDCPPSMFYQQPYWDYYKHFADYARRCSWLLSQGELACDIALYYPIETVQAEFVPTKEASNLHAFEIPGTWMTADYIWDGSEIEQTDAHFRAAANRLRAGGLDFEVVDDDSLRNSSAQDGTLVARGRLYRAIILPRTRWIALDVYRAILGFSRSGGLVLATGAPPERAVEGPEFDAEIALISRSLFPEGRGCFDRPEPELPSTLRECGYADFDSSSPDVFSHHRRVDDADVYFLVHHSAEEASDVRVSLKGGGSPVILEPLTGRSLSIPYQRRDDTVTLSLHLQPYDAFFVVLAEGAAETAQLRPWSKMREHVSLEGTWMVEFDSGDTFPLRTQDLPPLADFAPPDEHLELKELKPWEEAGLPELSGRATYTLGFVLDDMPPDGTVLDLGEVGIVADAWLNDVELGLRLWRPYRFDITDQLVKGHNVLKVRVANTLANAIQASYGSGRVPTAASPEQIEHYARFKPGQLRSGLIGPVKLLRPATRED